MNSGIKGVDFQANTNLANISFATIHAYPNQWEYTTLTYATDFNRYVTKTHTALVRDPA